MSNLPYTISVVLNREYGAGLRELLDNGPVWAIDSPANREVAQAFWTEFPSRDHLDGLTIFKARDDSPSEQTLIAQLDTIDMHHGIYSADPPYTVICVIGAALTATIRAAVSAYGFDSFIVTNDGFRAVRPLPQRADGR
jgi:hypothetical protein